MFILKNNLMPKKKTNRSALYSSPFTPEVRVRLRTEANNAGPVIRCIIARALMESGALVTFEGGAECLPMAPVDLRGLRVHMDKSVWVRDEEADRWGKSV